MKTFLVTGGAGFIGSHICESLLKKESEVIILDNFNDYYDPSIKRSNVEEIKKMMIQEDIPTDRLKILEGDIRDKNLLTDIFSEGIDIVIHLAAMAGVRYSIKNPEQCCSVNIMGTLRLLEECKNTGVNKFIFASSSSVYGNNKKTPFSEDDNVDSPISIYAASKKSGELFCSTYSSLYNISIACLRFFTVYGPRQRPDLAINKFTRLMLQDKEIPVFGDGNSERDYTFINDIVDGINRTIDWIDTDSVQFEVFNLGGDHTVSLKEMVTNIEEALGIAAKIKMLPMQIGDVQRTCADISKSKRILGYKPNTEFKQGIKNFVQWIMKEK